MLKKAFNSVYFSKWLIFTLYVRRGYNFSFRTILKMSTSDVSFFTRLLCVFAIFNIIILNFAKRTSFSNICTNILILRQNLRLLLLKPTIVCLFVFWLLGISITGFVIKIVFTLILGLIFITSIIYFIIKLYIFINVFIQKLEIFFRNFLYILFRILSIFIFYCFVFFAIILLIYIFVNLLHVFRNIVNLFYILSSCLVSVNIDKDMTHTVRLESNVTSLELLIIFPVRFLFLLVWCKQKCDKKVKIFLIFWMCMTFVFLKYKNSSDFFNDVRTCTRSEVLAFEFMNMCDDFEFLATRMNSTFYSVSKLKYRNLNSYVHLLIILSGDISLNPGPTHQHKLQCLNEWNIFKSRGLHFIHLNINSLLPKIEELRIIAKSTNAAIIGISESKLDESVLEPEIEIDHYKV